MYSLFFFLNTEVLIYADSQVLRAKKDDHNIGTLSPNATSYAPTSLGTSSEERRVLLKRCQRIRHLWKHKDQNSLLHLGDDLVAPHHPLQIVEVLPPLLAVPSYHQARQWFLYLRKNQPWIPMLRWDGIYSYSWFFFMNTLWPVLSQIRCKTWFTSSQLY